jgi:uncharacterized protein with PIN domain
MDLEEREGVEQVRERCVQCGARLTAAEIEAAIEGASETFLCARCAAKQVPVAEELEE